MYECSHMVPFDRADSRDLEKGRTGQEASRVEPSSKSGLNIRNTFCKWFLDCITLGALVNTVVFLVLMGLMKGQTWASVVMSVKMVSLCQERMMTGPPPGQRSLTMVPGNYTSYNCELQSLAACLDYQFQPCTRWKQDSVPLLSRLALGDLHVIGSSRDMNCSSS